MVPNDEDVFDDEVGYAPLPLQDLRTIRVRFEAIGDLGLIPYPIDPDDLEEE
jgi:hypothetical protein